jgi:hypothetical protein
MASRKPLVVGQYGLVEQLQSSDLLHIPSFPYYINWNIEGTTPSNSVRSRHIFTTEVDFYEGMPGSKCYSEIFPNTDVSCTLLIQKVNQSTVSLGTIDFGPNDHWGTFSQTTPVVNCLPGDILLIYVPHVDFWVNNSLMVGLVGTLP